MEFKYGGKVLCKVCLIAVVVKQGIFAGSTEMTFKKTKLSFASILSGFSIIFSFVMCHSILCCDLWENGMRKMMLYISTAGRVFGVTLIISINTAED